MLGDESLCASCQRNLTQWRDSRPTNEKYFKLANSRGKPCLNKVLIAGQNLKLFRLAYNRLFHMSKLSMERHRTQMLCDFVDKLKDKRNFFYENTELKHRLNNLCNLLVTL